MTSMTDLAATALLVHSTIPLPDAAVVSVEIASWGDEPCSVTIHTNPHVSAGDVAAIARAIDADPLSRLTDHAATMDGRVGTKHEVTVFFPLDLIDDVSVAANVPIKES